MKFKCEICGKTYDTIAERAACETACAKQKKAADEAAVKEAQEKEKKALREKITSSIEVTDTLVKEYESKFGTVPNLGRVFCDFATSSPKASSVAQKANVDTADPFREIKNLMFRSPFSLFRF